MPVFKTHPNNVLYLHGFNSHPDSFKARVTESACQALENPPRFIAPQLSPSPLEAYQQVMDILEDIEGHTLLVGSSFGGFIGTAIAEEMDMAGVILINPAINLIPLARSLVGKDHVNPVSGNTVHIHAHFVDELERLKPSHPACPEDYTVLLGGRDELLNYQDALCFYRGARILLLPNEDHAFNAYPEFVDRLFND